MIIFDAWYALGTFLKNSSFLRAQNGKSQPDRIRVLLMPLYYSWEKKCKGEKSQVGNENNKQCIKYEARTNDDAMCVNHLLHPKNAKVYNVCLVSTIDEISLSNIIKC